MNPIYTINGVAYHYTIYLALVFSSFLGCNIVMLLATGVSALLKCSKVINFVMIWNVEVMAGRGNLGKYDNWGEKTPVDIQCLKFSGRGLCKVFTGTVGRLTLVAHCTVRGHREWLCQLLRGCGARRHWSREHSRHWSFSNKRPWNTKTGSHTEPPEDT